MIKALEIAAIAWLLLMACGCAALGFIMIGWHEPDGPPSKADWRGPFR